MLDPVDLLLDELVADGGRWPPAREADVRAEVRTWRAFLESDRASLAAIAGWSRDREYKVDPLPALIADSWADHIFGEDLELEPAADSDTGALELLLEGNGDLASDLHAAERVVVGEGEGWWRIYRDTDVADVPLLEWHSRDAVVPLFVGRRLLAVALVTELEAEGKVIYRHLEIHSEGAVDHVLFRGSPSRIGETVPLESHPDLVELAEGLGAGAGEGQRWAHGLPMLMGRITNGRGVSRRLKAGVSDYARIADFLLDLNEAAAIGAENARLTAKRRIVIPEESLRPSSPDLVDDGAGSFRRRANGSNTFDAGEDVLVTSRLDAELGHGTDGPFKVLEYSFDAAALIAYKRDLVETALTRIGITPQYAGIVTGQGDGLALSGTALRLRLIPTTKAGRGKARPWDDALPQIIALMARVDELAEADGGFGRSWSDTLSLPSVERPSPLPQDEVEEAQVEATLVGAGVRSIRTSIERQHPDWTEEAYAEEEQRIRDDRASSPGVGLLGGGLP